MELESNNCRSCNEPLNSLFKAKKCHLCSNTYLDYKFCNQCCQRGSFNLLDKILRRKYCYPCNVMIEISKGNYDEVCRDPKILPKSSFVINIKLSTQSNEVLQVNNKNPLDDYQILENIGFGTFSEVFKVKDLSSDEVFAAKKMKPMTIAERRLFINEYIVTVLSDHKNIIKFYKIYDYKDNL